MRVLLDDCRRLLGPSPRRFGILDYAYLQVEPPRWLTGDNLLWSTYRDQKLLRAEGQVVWGVLVQANGALFEPGRDDNPAAILYSADPSFDDDLPTLRRLAKQLFSLKGTTGNGALQPFVDIITDEYRMDLNVPLPDALTGGRVVFTSSCMIHRRHLPTGILSWGFFPLLAAPNRSPAVMPVPARFWPDDLVAAWVDGALERIRPGFPLEAVKVSA